MVKNLHKQASLFYGLIVTTSVADLDPHHIGKPDPHQSKKSGPDPHDRQKPGAVEAHNRAMENHPGAVEAHSEPRSVLRPAVEEGDGSGSVLKGKVGCGAVSR